MYVNDNTLKKKIQCQLISGVRRADRVSIFKSDFNIKKILGKKKSS